MILYQYPVNLLTLLELYLKSSKYLKMGKVGLDGAICQSNFVLVRRKVKVVYVREMRIYLHSTAIIYILAMTNCPRHLTVDRAGPT